MIASKTGLYNSFREVPLKSPYRNVAVPKRTTGKLEVCEHCLRKAIH